MIIIKLTSFLAHKFSEVELKIKKAPSANRELLLYGDFIKLQSYL